MLSRAEQAATNLEQARELRASGKSYREIRRALGITSAQLGHIRRTLKREKAGRTRLRSADPQATDRDLPVVRSALPPGLRQRLVAAGYRTLGDLADPDRPALETLAGVGPHRARRVKRLLDTLDLSEGPSDLRAAVEDIFPELGDTPFSPKQPLSGARITR